MEGLQTHTDVRRRMQTHADECRCTQTNADARRCMQTNADERKVNYVRCVGGPNLKTYIYIYIDMYMKNPQFDSLVWGSLTLAPNAIRIKFEIQKLTVRLAIEM